MKRDPLPAGYELAKPSSEWQVGYPLLWAQGFSPPCWLVHNQRITIRPGETGEEAYEREYGSPPSRDEVVVVIEGF